MNATSQMLGFASSPQPTFTIASAAKTGTTNALRSPRRSPGSRASPTRRTSGASRRCLRSPSSTRMCRVPRRMRKKCGGPDPRPGSSTRRSTHSSAACPRPTTRRESRRSRRSSPTSRRCCNSVPDPYAHRPPANPECAGRGGHCGHCAYLSEVSTESLIALCAMTYDTLGADGEYPCGEVRRTALRAVHVGRILLTASWKRRLSHQCA